MWMCVGPVGYTNHNHSVIEIIKPHSDALNLCKCIVLFIIDAIETSASTSSADACTEMHNLILHARHFDIGFFNINIYYGGTWGRGSFVRNNKPLNKYIYRFSASIDMLNSMWYFNRVPLFFTAGAGQNEGFSIFNVFLFFHSNIANLDKLYL